MDAHQGWAEESCKRRKKKILEQQASHEMSKSLVKNWENTIEVGLASLANPVCINLNTFRVKDLKNYKQPERFEKKKS